MSPRQTMSLRTPLGCRQFQASQSFFERARRLEVGWSPMRLRMKARSASVTARPRYFNFTSMEKKLTRGGRGTQIKNGVFFMPTLKLSSTLAPPELPTDCRSRLKAEARGLEEPGS